MSNHRRTACFGDVWVAKIADVEGPAFKDVSEEAVREQVRMHLLGLRPLVT